MCEIKKILWEKNESKNVLKMWYKNIKKRKRSKKEESHIKK